MRKCNLLVTAAAITVSLTALVSCEKENTPSVQDGSCEPVSWIPDSPEITILPGETAKVYGTVTWSDGHKTSDFEATRINSADKDIVWTYGGWNMVGVTPGESTATAETGAWTGSWEGERNFSQEIKVTVVNPEKPIIGLELSPAHATIKAGEEINFKVYAVYADTRREISPIVCDFDVTDDGAQHIAYIFKDGKANVNASQGTGETYFKATYVENGITVEANSTIESVL
jgi:hypothetical protein